MPRVATKRLSTWFAVAATLLVAATGSGCGATKAKVIVTVPDSPAATPPGQLYRTPSGSMEPTYPIGARVAIAPVTTPRISSVVIFHPPEGAAAQLCGPQPHTVKPGGQACSAPVPKEETTTTLIKRVVAGPGDQLYIRAGRVFRKPVGAQQFSEEPASYATKPCASSAPCDFSTPITIPAGHWFLLGDNRGESDDSRFWGPVPSAWIVGTAGRCVEACGP
jgi:signal peptidase I